MRAPRYPTVQVVDQLLEVTAEAAVEFSDLVRADTWLQMLRMLNVDVLYFVHKRFNLVVVGNVDLPGAPLDGTETIQGPKLVLPELIEQLPFFGERG